MTTETTTPAFVTKGNGTAVHVAQMSGYILATLCDRWGKVGAYNSRIRPITTDHATCKSCLKIAAKTTPVVEVAPVTEAPALVWCWDTAEWVSA